MTVVEKPQRKISVQISTARASPSLLGPSSPASPLLSPRTPVSPSSPSGSGRNRLAGYQGRFAKEPRKYTQGPLNLATQWDTNQRSALAEYKERCQQLGAEPNSLVLARLTPTSSVPIPRSRLLAEDGVISLRDTYLGERGFLAVLPMIAKNTRWTELDVSNNGLRNEAVLHLVDLLMHPQQQGRDFSLNLSRNPISQTGVYALLELVEENCRVQYIDLRRTRVPRRLTVLLEERLELRRSQVQFQGTVETVDGRRLSVEEAAALQEF
eukprot:TRINITY_DN973_c2_g1_i1.p1 TRINITY_DN973_c2_g1~~TRINITY_DN973_c2_g1_i1.p1  ORF type:complete len:268 (+),score=52.91 TRINITY_DN973_c2_g1_i1:204-1007(+)